MNFKYFNASKVLILFIFCLTTGCAVNLNRIKKQASQSEHILEKKITKTIRTGYLLYLPESYFSNKKQFPLMLFLHGAGERGDSLGLVKKHGPPKIVENKKDFPFIVLSPQCPENEWWSIERLDILMDEIIKNYRVDKDRIYLTGLSMGGFGTWEYTNRFPDKFAAIAPICGGGESRTVKRISHLPIWAFHGAKDKVVLIKESQEMVDALKKLNADVRFTIYPEAGHDSWTKTYDNPELYEWFLKHKRKSTSR